MASRPPSVTSVLLGHVYVLAVVGGLLLLTRWLWPERSIEWVLTVLAIVGTVGRIPWPKRRRVWVVLLAGFTLLTVYLGALGLFNFIGPVQWASYFAICVAVIVMTLVAMSTITMPAGPPDGSMPA